MKRKLISEATGTGSAGKFKVPIVLAPQLWNTDQLGPYTEPVYNYLNAELAYEEADGDFKETPEERERIEKRTDKVAEIDAYLKKFYTYQNDDEGSDIGDIKNPKVAINSMGLLNKNESLRRLIKKVIRENFR